MYDRILLRITQVYFALTDGTLAVAAPNNARRTMPDVLHRLPRPSQKSPSNARTAIEVSAYIRHLERPADLGGVVLASVLARLQPAVGDEVSLLGTSGGSGTPRHNKRHIAHLTVLVVERCRCMPNGRDGPILHGDGGFFGHEFTSSHDDSVDYLGATLVGEVNQSINQPRTPHRRLP